MIKSTLNVKISIELKDKLRNYAQESSETLASATENLLLKAFNDIDDEVEVDSQNTYENRISALTDTELKALRKLLKKKK